MMILELVMLAGSCGSYCLWSQSLMSPSSVRVRPSAGPLSGILGSDLAQTLLEGIT